MRPYILVTLLAMTLMTACLGPQEQPVTKDEALKLAHCIDSAIGIEDADFFVKMINMDIFMQKVAAATGLKKSRGLKKEMERGLKTANMGGQIINSISDGKGSYQLVKHYEKNKVHHLIYRLYGEGGLNYHDFELTRIGNKVYVADLFIYLTGENFSVSAADIISSFKDGDKSSAEQRQNATKFQTVARMVREKNYQQAKRLFDQLPAVIKNRKVAQVTHLLICSGLGEEEYYNASVAFEQRYRNEPNMYISLIDAYFLQKDFAKTLGVINSLDSMIDRDPFLDYQRGIIYYNWGKPEESRQALESLNQNLPQFQMGIIELMHNYLTAGDYAKARTLIGSYRQNETFDQVVLDTNLAMYPDFKEEE
jgi:hypothetical protein